MFVNKIICSECGGECCKKMPGSCYPEDFGLPGDFSSLDVALNSGKYAIDWWEGDARGDMEELSKTHYIRPATKDKIGVLYDPSWGGECVFLAKDGCVLKEDKRPLGCKKLEPKKNTKCVTHDNVNKRNAAIAWIPYQEKLTRQLVNFTT
jgi:hypothetical protein